MYVQCMCVARSGRRRLLIIYGAIRYLLVALRSLARLLFFFFFFFFFCEKFKIAEVPKSCVPARIN